MRQWEQSSPFQLMTDKRSKAVDLAVTVAAGGYARHILWTLRRHGYEDNVELVSILSEALARVGATKASTEHRVDL